METKYPLLLSPFFIGEKFVKNRMAMSRAMPTVVTGCDDQYALETIEVFAGMMAKNGAAIVTCASPVWKSKFSKQTSSPPPPPDPDEMTVEDLDGPGPGGHDMGDPEVVGMYAMDGVDLSQSNNKNRYARAVAAVHSYGSLASISMMDIEPSGWSFSSIPEEYLDGIVNDFAAKAEIYQKLGFDVLTFYMSYRNSLMAQSLSPDLNRRSDKYGGTCIEARARFTFEIFHRVREKCPGILIEAQISGEDYPGGFTQEEIITYLKLAEAKKIIDIVQVRSRDGGTAHPIGMNSVKGQHDTLRFAEMLKANGIGLVIAPIGGFQDPEENERILAEGKADMIYMARAFICDSHYGEKLYAGRNDYRPCIRCNKCHTKIDDSNAGCSVNPEFILNLYHNPLYPLKPAASPKRVAVIGGGPAGMEAALIASQRGHMVTLYEATNHLGGQLQHADLVPFKWPLRDFKDYLVNQLLHANIQVLLETCATPELLRSKSYDAIFYAAGAKEQRPPIPGVDGNHVYTPLEAYAHATSLGQNIVVIGGSETGIETAHFFALQGRNVTVLTRNGQLAPGAQPIHYMDIIKDLWKAMPNLSFICRVTTTEICPDGVTYRDYTGVHHKIICDDVVACGGSTAVLDHALEFAKQVPYFCLIGDCQSVSDLRHGLFTAYTAAAAL